MRQAGEGVTGAVNGARVSDLRLEGIQADSYTNFHAKGVDYVCLERSPGTSLRVYFFDGVAPGVDVVFPHNHRYRFSSLCLAGGLSDREYTETPIPGHKSEEHQKFAWRTPLNGGDGFDWIESAPLWTYRYSWHEAEVYPCPWYTTPNKIHTISVQRSDTVLLIRQHESVVPRGLPTVTYVPGDSLEPPSLDGLYDEMPMDRLIRRLAALDELLAGQQVDDLI
jgi:hypothetical protein